MTCSTPPGPVPATRWRSPPGSSISADPLTPYLLSRYRDHGRGPVEYDCWGLTRCARHRIYGLSLLPSYGAISAADKPALTRAAREVMAGGFRPADPLPGAIATCWRGRLCTHVALVIDVDGRLAVLETNQASGPRWRWLADFASTQLKVIYYDDRNLSQHPAGPAD